MQQDNYQAYTIPAEMAGQRLDQALAEIQAEFSRSRLTSWIRDGKVTVNGQVVPPKTRVYGGEAVLVQVELEPSSDAGPEDIPLDVLYEDEHLLIINKPAGLVVHPAAGNPGGTLQNALLFRDPSAIELPRAGIVHRLDKETSGILMVARTLEAHRRLVEQLQQRLITREYLALCQGILTVGGTVDQPIGRHPADRKRMAVREGGRPSVTHYRVLERFTEHTLLQLRLETGRTHQIRVHMAHLRHPLVGDPVYGGRPRLPRGWSPEAREQFSTFRRQALHAARLGLDHPVSGEYMEWQVDMPGDMQSLLDLVRAWNMNDDELD